MIKVCVKCKNKLPATVEYFYKHTAYKDGLRTICKQCMKEYCQINADKRRQSSKEWYKRNKKYRKEYKRKWQERNPQYLKNYRATLRGHTVQITTDAKSRCTNPNNKDYKHYGGRGIKLCFTSQELYDWIVRSDIEPRGKDMHRIDNNDNYTLNNIVFLARNEHLELHICR